MLQNWRTLHTSMTSVVDYQDRFLPKRNQVYRKFSCFMSTVKSVICNSIFWQEITFFIKIKPIFDTLKRFRRSKFSQFWYFCTPRFHFFFNPEWQESIWYFIFYIPILCITPQPKSCYYTHALFNRSLTDVAPLECRHLVSETLVNRCR